MTDRPSLVAAVLREVARAIARVQLNGGDPDQPAVRWNGTEMEPQEFPVWKDYMDEARAAVAATELERPSAGADAEQAREGAQSPNKLTEAEWRARAELIENWAKFCDADPVPEDFTDRMAAAGFIELRAVTKADLETSFAAERGIEKGGSIWVLTDHGEAVLHGGAWSDSPTPSPSSPVGATPFDARAWLDANYSDWEGRVFTGYHIEEILKAVVHERGQSDLAQAHDARVAELLAANNAEVERRRAAEREVIHMRNIFSP